MSQLTDIVGALIVTDGLPGGFFAEEKRDTVSQLRRFADGLAADLRHYGVALIGGDTVATPGPLTLSLTAFGRVACGGAVLRSGAQVGDILWVSGTIGDGALGLMAARGALDELTGEHRDFLADRYRLPQPRVDLGPHLVGLAHAAMDVSDGLIQDLGHLCRASGVGAVLRAGDVPLSSAARAALSADGGCLVQVLTGGDDYELLLAAPPEAAEALAALAATAGVPLTAIGQVVAGTGVTVVDSAGRILPPDVGQGGWRHFRRRDDGGPSN